MQFNITAKLLDACVIGIVSAGDTYGYDLTQKTKDTIQVSETALYPVLRRLLKEGLLTSYNQTFDGRNRKYYSITEEGKKRLEEYKQEWESHKALIDSILK